MIKNAYRLGFCLSLAACTAVTPLPEVVVPGGQYANVQGEADVIVRTFIPRGNTRAEVHNVPCDVSSSLYNAALTTPARLIVPNFGPQSPQIRVKCQSGDLRGAARLRIITEFIDPDDDLFDDDILGRRRGDGVRVGIVIGTLGVPYSDYPNASVLLRPVAAGEGAN